MVSFRGIGYLFLLSILLSSIVSANSDYCSPYPNDIITTVDHQGIWYNITLTYPTCYVCKDNGAAYGDVDCVICSNFPIASFTKSTSLGAAPLTVAFTDTSIGAAPLSYYWVIGGIIYTTQNPTVTFAVGGVYSANLTVTNSYGSNTSTVQTVAVGNAPVASFTKDKSSGQEPLTVYFTSTSIGDTPLIYSWDFGDKDSTNSTDTSPVHTFKKVGTYNIKLTVGNVYGASTSAGQIIIVGKVPFKLYETHGSTWIGWTWEVNSSYIGTNTKLIGVVDNKEIYNLSLSNVSAGGAPSEYYMSGLNPQESHQFALSIVNGSGDYVIAHSTLTVQTSIDFMYYILLFAVSIGFFFLAIYLQKGIIPTILLVLSILINGYLAIALQGVNSGFAWVVLLFTLFPGYVLIHGLYEMFTRSRDWSE